MLLFFTVPTLCFQDKYPARRWTTTLIVDASTREIVMDTVLLQQCTILWNKFGQKQPRANSKWNTRDTFHLTPIRSWFLPRYEGKGFNGKRH
jgi:hypothetical protein